ncbi:MAG: hypothetical protein ACRDKG_12150 [Actinomycetota bacterium]
MCMSCGCEVPEFDHGDEDNITTKNLLETDEAALERAADAQGLTVEQVRENVEKSKRYL